VEDRTGTPHKKPIGKSDGFRRFKLSLKRLIGREPRLKLDYRVSLTRFGDWFLLADIANADQRVYSFGVGEDIDFDLALIEVKGLSVFAFDPTPNSVEWLNRQDLPENFHFYPWAASGHDGSLYLYPRIRPDGSQSKVMYTIMAAPTARDDGVEVPAKTIGGIMQDLGHDRIDILKMDIEGAEYEVLDHLLKSSVRPQQLLVEFHHRFAGIGIPKTLNAISHLRQSGYGLAHISSTGREFLFLLNSAVSGQNQH